MHRSISASTSFPYSLSCKLKFSWKQMSIAYFLCRYIVSSFQCWKGKCEKTRMVWYPIYSNCPTTICDSLLLHQSVTAQWLQKDHNFHIISSHTAPFLYTNIVCNIRSWLCFIMSSLLIYPIIMPHLSNIISDVA